MSLCSPVSQLDFDIFQEKETRFWIEKAMLLRFDPARCVTHKITFVTGVCFFIKWLCIPIVEIIKQETTLVLETFDWQSASLGKVSRFLLHNRGGGGMHAYLLLIMTGFIAALNKWLCFVPPGITRGPARHAGAGVRSAMLFVQRLFAEGLTWSCGCHKIITYFTCPEFKSNSSFVKRGNACVLFCLPRHTR